MGSPRPPSVLLSAAKDLSMGSAQILRCAQDDSSPSVRASGGKPRPGSYLSFNPRRCSIYNTREYMYITGETCMEMEIDAGQPAQQIEIDQERQVKAKAYARIRRR